MIEYSFIVVEGDILTFTVLFYFCMHTKNPSFAPFTKVFCSTFILEDGGNLHKSYKFTNCQKPITIFKKFKVLSFYWSMKGDGASFAAVFGLKRVEQTTKRCTE